MTETEWLSSDDPIKLYMFLNKKTPRKGLLFGCATCCRIQHLLTGYGMQVLEVAERFAEGTSTLDEMNAYSPKPPDWSGAFGRCIDSGSAVAFVIGIGQSRSIIVESKGVDVPICIYASQLAANATSDIPAEWKAQAELVRDIFGNPFRPITFSPSWRTEHTVGLASQMYESRNFTTMPFLADALEEAGCDNADMLLHCRGEGPHVRGCWVVDLILGKE